MVEQCSAQAFGVAQHIPVPAFAESELAIAYRPNDVHRVSGGHTQRHLPSSYIRLV